MSPELEAALHHIGWFPERRVEEGQLAAWLRVAVQDFGCHLFPEAVRVLQEFGGLALRTVSFGAYAEDSIVVLDQQSVQEDHFGWVRNLWEINEVLFPIGYELREQCTFAISPSGRVFARGINTFFCGDSFEEFLENEVRFFKGVLVPPSANFAESSSELEQLYKSVYNRGA